MSARKMVQVSEHDHNRLRLLMNDIDRQALADYPSAPPARMRDAVQFALDAAERELERRRKEK